jgi:hypothetical protein
MRTVASLTQTRLSIVQLMKLVVFAAVASACIAPMVNLWRAGVAPAWMGVVLEGVAVPLAMAGLSIVLIRRGPRRDRLFMWLLLISVTVALITASWFFATQTFPLVLDPAIPINYPVVSINLALVLILASALAFLSTHLAGFRLTNPWRRLTPRWSIRAMMLVILVSSIVPYSMHLWKLSSVYAQRADHYARLGYPAMWSGPSWRWDRDAPRWTWASSLEKKYRRAARFPWLPVGPDPPPPVVKATGVADPPGVIVERSPDDG